MKSPAHLLQKTTPPNDLARRRLRAMRPPPENLQGPEGVKKKSITESFHP